MLRSGTLVLAIFLAATSANAGRIEGLVLEAGVRTPVPGAIVEPVEPAESDAKPPADAVVDPDGFGDEFTAYTDETGAFVLNLRSDRTKTVDVVVVANGYKRAVFSVTPDQKSLVAYIEKIPGEGDTLITERRSRANIARGSHRISGREVNELPGTYGDPAKAIENFPGMGRVLRSQGSILIRGANPEESAIYVDDYEVPDLYHFTGSTSVINIPFVESVELVPGAFSARFGRATGGLVNLHTRRLPLDNVHGFAKLDIIDGGAYVGVPIGDNAAIGASARRSWLDLLRQGQLISGTANDEITLVPTYWDYQLKLDWDVTEGHELVAFAFGSGDRELYTREGSAVTPPFESIRDADFHRVSLRYKLPVGAFTNTSTLVGGYERRVFSEQNGLLFSERNTFDLQFRNEAIYRTNDSKVTVGIDSTTRLDAIAYRGLFARTDAFTIPTPDLDGAVRQQRTNDVLWRGTLGVYAEGTFEPLEGLLLTPGFRLDGYLIDGEPELSIEPRFAGSYALLPGDYGFTIKAAGGVFGRPPSPDDVLGAKQFGLILPTQRAFHVQGGFEQQIGPGRSLQATVYGILRTGQPDRAPNFPITTSPLEAPVVGSGSAISTGAEFLIRVAKPGKYFAWLSYSIAKHTRYDGPGPRAVPYAYPTAFDTTHLATAIGQLDLIWGFRAGVRGRIASGMPRNDLVTGATFDADSAQYIPRLAPKGIGRFPPFGAIDLRVDWSYIFPWFELDLYADLVNVLNIRPVEGTVYSYDFSQQQPLVGLPFIPTVGFKVTF